MEIIVKLLLGLTSVVGVTVIVWRAWMLRWDSVVPPQIITALEECRSREGVKTMHAVCEKNPSPLGRLIQLTIDRLDWPKDDTMDSLETAARHEVVQLERGLVVLEVIV